MQFVLVALYASIMPVPTGESKTDVPTSISHTYENHNNSPSNDPNVNCYTNYNTGIVQDVHPPPEVLRNYF